MSLIAATGMKLSTGLRPCGSEGSRHRTGGSPGSFIEPYPWPKPPPGSPIWPSMAARVSPIHGACSPWRRRCSDQLTVTIVRCAAIRRRQFRECRRVDPADRRGPLRRFRLAIVDAEQIALEPLVPGAVGVEELPVGEVLGGQHIGQCQHDRHVGTGNGGQPAAVALDVAAQRADRDDACRPCRGTAAAPGAPDERWCRRG